jgi:hypothetical protein
MLKKLPTPRPKQTNCSNEPPYPDHHTVLFLLSAPHLTAHAAYPECPSEYPHPISTCPLFQACFSPAATHSKAIAPHKA